MESKGRQIITLPSGEKLPEAVAVLGDLRPGAHLVNCCGANFVTAAIPELVHLVNGPVGGYANAEWVTSGDCFDGPQDDPEGAQQKVSSLLDPDEYTSEAAKWVEAGATIIGGCCGTRPEYIRRLREMLDTR